MKASIPTISPLLRSDVQGRLLAELFLGPAAERTLTGLARDVETSMPTVHREIERLVASGFVTERRSGRNRYVRANPDHPLYEPVRMIVEYAYGPQVILQSMLSGVVGVEDAFIYGSWAARMDGIPGPDPADIDVLVIGRPDRSAVFDVASRGQAALKREVNIRSVDRERWDAADDSFLKAVKSRPLVRLDLGRGGVGQ